MASGHEQSDVAASAAVAAEITQRVRERGLVVWVDAEKHFTGLVDRLATGDVPFPFPVVRFRGSYLELMLALEPYGSGLERDKVLIHLPGLNKETVKETPALELYKAGSVFEKNLATAIRDAAVGHARPDEIERFVAEGDLSLEKADAWLRDQDARPQDKMSILLDALGVEDVVLGLLSGKSPITKELPQEGDKLLAFLGRTLGLDDAWRRFRLGDAPLRPDAAASLVASFLMAVEFVHDLKEPPVTDALLALTKLGAHAKRCRELAQKARAQHPDDYESFANELQDRFEQERTGHHAEALGSIDTFRFEEATVRSHTLAALARGEWATALELSSARTVEQCFWIRRSEPLQRTWEVTRLAAKVGKSIASTRKALDGCGSMQELVERYAERLAPVDREHRIFEQRAHALIASDLEDYDALIAARDAVRAAYRAWNDGINRAFYEACRTHGALPSRDLRQRAIASDVLKPAAERGPVAFLMVDALRYEMAQALAAELEREKFLVTLRPRLAELPSVTAIGMNVLAVFDEGKPLALAQSSGRFGGFATGSFRVHDPASRVKSIEQRLGATVDFEIEKLAGMKLEQVKQKLKTKPKVVVVRSQELDTAGENELHLGTFEQTLTRIRSAVSLLSQAGIERFVVVADHGFLMQDGTTINADFGATKRDPDRRHAMLDQASGMSDVLEVRLSQLEYDVKEEKHLVFRADSGVWKTKEAVPAFVHGGNSLQERVIPVLELIRAHARGKTLSKYEVVARAEPAHLGRQRLSVQLRLQAKETATLGFFAPKGIPLAIRVVGREAIGVTLIAAGPPARLEHGQIVVVPNQEAARVEFELEGIEDEMVQVEIFHPEGKEDVASKVVDGFFAVASRRRSKRTSGVTPAVSVVPQTPSVTVPVQPPRAPTPAPFPAVVPSEPVALKVSADVSAAWPKQIDDDGYRKVFEIIEKNRIINEVELQQVLGSSRRVRAFALQYDELVQRIPFSVEVTTVNGMKAYKRRD